MERVGVSVVESENNSDTFESLPKRRRWEGCYINVKGMLCRKKL